MRYYSIVIICLVLTGCNVNNNKLPDEEIKSTKVINKNEIQFASKYKKKPVDSNVPMIKYCQEQNIKKKEKIVNEFVKAREQEFKDNATKFHSTQGMRKEYAEEYGKELPKIGVKIDHSSIIIFRMRTDHLIKRIQNLTLI